MEYKNFNLNMDPYQHFLRVLGNRWKKVIKETVLLV
jgi:hypothetical protein